MHLSAYPKITSPSVYKKYRLHLGIILNKHSESIAKAQQVPYRYQQIFQEA